MNYGTKMREIRKQMRLTLEDISQRTGFTKSFISQIENNKNSPSISSLKKICNALSTPISDLFEDERSAVHILTKEDYHKQTRNKTDYNFLASRVPNRKLEPIMAKLKVGGEINIESRSNTYKHIGEEFGYILSGELSVTVGNNKYIIKEGESIYFNSTNSVKIKNNSENDVLVLWIRTPPGF